MTKISLITIGSELLKGRIINTNASKIGTMLRPHGYKLSRTVVIPDEEKAIAKTLRQELEDHDLVLISGGLGSTEDDITKKTIARVMGTELVLHAPTFAYLKERFEARKRPFSQRIQQQAFLPANCRVLPNRMGTAPGMLFEIDSSYAISLPGVPFELMHLMEHEVLPFMKEKLAPGLFQHEILRLAHISESETADRIQKIRSNLPETIQIAYLPRKDGLWLELFVESQGQEKESELLHDLNQTVDTLRALFPEKLYTQGDQPLSQLLHARFLGQQKTLSIAESITGGGITSELVSQSGASNFLKGGICAYDVNIKERVLGVKPETISTYGVVSSEVAEEMAIRVRNLFQTDIGLATTGWAEPDGSTPPEVWMGYADEVKTISIHATLYGNRIASIDRAIQYAMRLCLVEME
ncbi:MAG: CinA family nicotinamide mononucleotide deamidase-related protein [Bacteroidota bacterium]